MNIRSILKELLISYALIFNKRSGEGHSGVYAEQTLSIYHIEGSEHYFNIHEQHPNNPELLCRA